MLEKVYEKTQGHPWSLVCFARLSHVHPVKKLLEEIPDFGEKQHAYVSKECWNHLSEPERDFLMRVSIFARPLSYEALKVCSKTRLSDVLVSLAKNLFVVKRGEDYYVHDIIKDFALSNLRGDLRLYVEAQREAAEYYQRNLCAENLLLVYYHLKEAGDIREAIDSIIQNIKYFWQEGFWADVEEVLRESLDFFKDEETIMRIYFCLGTIVHKLGEWDKAIDYYEKDLETFEKLGDIHGMAVTKYNIANILRDKKQHNEALKLYFESEKTLKKLGDKLNLMKIYYDFNPCYDDMEQEKRAEEYYQKAEELRLQLGIESV
jgi:tetratricopeptide (TPR) repeat protein